MSPHRLARPPAAHHTARVRISHYEVHDELARGGMGVVYRAIDARSGARVVLKLLKVDTEKARRRLAREADAMRRLTHPSVLTLYDAGEHMGQPYLALPYVEGESLQDRLDRDGPLSVDEAITVATQVGAGLQAAHALGLLHRDVKPANVLVDARLYGTVKLTDFGLVKDTGAERSAGMSLSIKGRFLGTPGYWPPEQAHGRLNELGPAADVYGLGALIYALLSGRPPRAADTLIQALDAFEVPVESLPPPVPLWLDDLLQRCLDDDPRARPALDQVLLVLEARGAQTESTTPDPPGPAGTPPRPSAATVRPGRPLRWVAALALLCGALGLSYWASTHRGSGGAPLIPGSQSEEVAASWSEEHQEQAQRLQREGNHTAAISHLSVALPGARNPAAVYAARGRSKLALGDFDGAQGDFSEAIALDPDDAVAYRSRGHARAWLGRHAEAVEDCTRALSLLPDDPEALAVRGSSRLLNGDGEGALRDLDRALELDPDHTSALATRGSYLNGQRRSAEALEDLDRALQLEPNNAVALANRGFSKAQLGRHAEAVEDYDRALQLLPGLRSAIANRGTSKAWLGLHEEAVEDLERALELEPDDPVVLETLAASKAAIARDSEAIVDFNRLLELAPESLVALTRRGDSKLRLGRYLAAIADYDRVLELDPNNALASCSRGVAMAGLGRDAEAIHDFDRGLAQDARYAWPFLARATSKANLGRYAEALEDLARASALDDLTPDDRQRIVDARARYERALDEQAGE